MRFRAFRLNDGWTHPHFPVLLAVLAVLLCLPALWVGWQWDDYAHQLALHQFPEIQTLTPPPWFMFTFANGNPIQNHRLMDAGWLPWWSLDTLRLAFFRPFTVLTHWLDHLFWPDSPVMMHLQSLLWFGALIFAAAVCYRRLMGNTWTAGMAALLFSLDGGHGVPAGWIANRNALVASVFVVLMLISHDAWRKSNWKPGRWAGPLLFLLGLLSGEMALSGAGFLFSYALFLETGPIRRRITGLVPYAAAGLLWLIPYRMLGFGASGSSWYVDPVGNPVDFLRALLERAPILFMGQWGFISADIYMMLSIPGIWTLWGVGTAFLSVIAIGLRPLVKADPTAKFWGLSLLLSIPPVCTTFPFDRLMLLSGLASMGLMALFLEHVFSGGPKTGFTFFHKSRLQPACSTLKKFPYALAAALAGIHLIFSPLSLPFRAWSPAILGKTVQNLAGVLPPEIPLNRQDLVIVNGPCAPVGGFFLSAIRRLKGDTVPRRVRVLSSGIHALTLTRTDPFTLILRPQGGFLDHVGAVHSEPGPGPDFLNMNYMFQQMDRTFRDDHHPFKTGQEIHLNGLSIRITVVSPDGRPEEAAFRFAVPLEDPSLRWLQWQHDTLIPFSPPPVHETVRLLAPDLSFW